jgi:coenzyme F420-reducing hydrogenase delta subunit
MSLLFSFLNYMGIEKERTRVEWVSAAEGARFSAVMNDFVKTVTELGENKRLTDLRIKEGK